MYKTDFNALVTELRRFNQRKLTKGELVLLAYVIASEIPLLPVGEDNARAYVIGQGLLIERIVYRLNEYAHVDTDARRELTEIISKFVLWRSGVAKGTKALFTGQAETMVDDLSGLTRVLDVGTLCSISDTAESANWLVRTFHSLFHMEESVLKQEQNKPGV